MQYDNSDDPFGFWNDEPTRPLRRTHAGTRSHGDTAATTRMIPVVRSEQARPPAPTRPPRNPLVTRIGLLVGVMLLFVPIALSLRSSKTHLEASGLDPVGTVSIGQLPPAPTEITDPPTTEVATTLSIATEALVVTAPPTEAAVVTEPATAAPTTAAAKKPTAKPKPTTAPTQPPATAVQVAEKTPCTLTYTVAKNDAWSTIASRAKVSLKDLLAANDASTSTLLLPGKVICLPAGATVPAPPATTVPPTKPPTTPAPTPAPKPPTTPAPTAPPSTQPPAPPNTTSRAQAAQIIRDVWPDDLEDTAIQIATRESNLIPTAHNSCCYGLFQIYYAAHKSWLASIGVTSAAQLYDPQVNANAAYALYRTSGWAPWGGAPTTTTVAG
jgi:LysM repeat protein